MTDRIETSKGEYTPGRRIEIHRGSLIDPWSGASMGDGLRLWQGEVESPHRTSWELVPGTEEEIHRAKFLIELDEADFDPRLNIDAVSQYGFHLHHDVWSHAGALRDCESCIREAHSYVVRAAMELGWLLAAGLAVDDAALLADLHRQVAVEMALDDAAESKGVPHWRDLDDAEIIEAATWGARHG